VLIIADRSANFSAALDTPTQLTPTVTHSRYSGYRLLENALSGNLEFLECPFAQICPPSGLWLVFSSFTSSCEYLLLLAAHFLKKEDEPTGRHLFDSILSIDNSTF
jgi:hypothetical protein